MGHIFQLGRKYAEALGLKVLDENGKLVTVTMGSYGVGVTRAVAAVAEGCHDELGLVWPREIAPADVHVVATGKDEEVFARPPSWPSPRRRGVAVHLRRPRKVSPGVKFNDAELIGVPTIVVVGRGLADGKIEIKDRAAGKARACRSTGRGRGRVRGAAFGELRGTDRHAVIFDWGGTLTPWHTIDLASSGGCTPEVYAEQDHADELSARILSAEADAWGRGRDGPQQRPPRRDLPEAGVDKATGARRADGIPAVLGAAHVHRQRRATALGRVARERHPGRRPVQHDVVPGAPPRGLPARRVLDLIDGDVYSCEIAWTKPHPEAFHAAAEALGVSPAEAVYVGDRPFEDVQGARGRHARDPGAALEDPRRYSRSRST